YAMVLLRFVGIDLNGNFLQAPTTADLPLTDYLQQLGSRLIMFGIPIASIGAAYRLLRGMEPAGDRVVDRQNDISGWIPETTAVRLAVVVAVGMLFVYLHLEFDRTLGYLYLPCKLPMLTLLWLGLGALVLHSALGHASRIWPALLAVFTVCLLIKLFAFDLWSWNLSPQMVYAGEYSFRDAGMRLLDFGAVVGFLGGAYALLSVRQPRQTAGTFLGCCGLGLLFIYLSLEVNSFLFHYVPGLRPGGISILWSLFALGLILPGIRRNIRVLRLVGLALFAIVAGKVFFNDLSRLDQLYRIVAFILLGILVLSGSFVYLKYREKFASQNPSDKEPIE
ncbi:MAG: DUF2339 domain-containing protein, partial [Planctomycetes bacterium]|nr:DUF2339 domain-containing protein [Planctomycetota bacterium]